MNAIELPFLYHTRTILRCSSSSTALRNTKPNHRPQRLLTTAPSIPAEEYSESFLSQKAKRVANITRRKSKPTITRTEKHVFDEIFHEIETSPGRPARTAHAGEETDPNAILRLFVQESGQRQSLSEPLNTHKTQEKPTANGNDFITRYPSSLQNTAQRVSQQLAPPEEQLPYKSFQPSRSDVQASPRDRIPNKDPRHGVYRPLDAVLETEAEVFVAPQGLQLRNFDAIKDDEIAKGTFRGKTAEYVEKELTRISGELQSCISAKSQRGAFKMWEICQREIIPIVLQLDKQPKILNTKKLAEEMIPAALKLQGSDADKTTTKKTSKKPKQTPKLLPVASPIPIQPRNLHAIPVALSPLSVITPLYPTLTLLALRLFTVHYPTTPFALTLYTTLRSSSPHARILALNVNFYNTLLAHIWAIYSDLRQICALLSEMQSSGVEFDGKTYTLIRGIEEERWAEFHLAEGSRGNRWWERPEQKTRYAGLMEWKDVVERRLLEQGMGHLLSEREYSAELLGADDKGEKAGVWL